MFEALKETLREELYSENVGEGRHNLLEEPRGQMQEEAHSKHISKRERIEWFSVPDGFQMNFLEQF